MHNRERIHVFALTLYIKSIGELGIEQIDFCL